jgi:hypothetical protein
MAHAPLPIGARPSVPPRPDPNLAGIDDPVYKPLVPPPPPYGMQPLGLDQTQFLGRGVTLKPVPPVASGGFYAPSSSGAVVAPLPGSAQTQYVPPLPAPQETCLVNGFDPAWGEPPAAFNGLPLDFDAQMGAYTFDPNRREYVDALERYRTQQLEHTLHGGPPADPYLAQLAHWHSHLASQYRTGYMLQPYKSGNEPGWRTRWIPQRRAVSCRTD